VSDPSAAYEPTATGEIVDFDSRRRARETGPLSPDLAAFLADNFLSVGGGERVVESVINRVDGMSKQALASLTPARFDQVSMSPEDRLVLSDLQAQYAKYGFAPLNTVEGLAKLSDLLRQLFETNQLLPAETRVKAARLSQDLQIIEMNRALVVEAEHIRAKIALGNVKTEAEVAQALAGGKVKEAVVTAKEQDVKLTGRSKSADIDLRVQDAEKRAELIRKSIRSHRATSRAVIDEAVRPAVRFFIKWGLIIGIPLVIVANLVCNQPGHAHTFFLGSVNQIWHSLYMPLRNGVVQIYRQHHHPWTS
jgi:hypothetical protein